MNAKFLVSWLVIFVLWFLAGWGVHGALLADEYAATGLFRPEADQMRYLGWMTIAHVVMAGAFVWIYTRGKEAKPWLGQGLRYGLAIALLAAVPIYVIYYCVQPLPGMLVLRQSVYDTIVLLILGAVVAYLYRDKTAG